MLLINGNQTPSTPEGVNVEIQGELILAGNPSEPLEAATKQYVDSRFNSLDASRLIEGTILTARLPGFTGDVTSENGSNILSLVDTGVASGTYTKVTVDSKGRVTGGATLTESDIPSLNWSKVTSGVPTTLAGYGIVDGLSIYGGTLSSNLTVTGGASGNRDAVTKGYVDGFQVTGAVETGVVMKRAVSSSVTGYLRANGADVSKTTYSDLYNVIGDAFVPSGGGSWSTNAGHRIGSGKPWRLQWDINDTSGNMGAWSIDTITLPETLRYSQAVVTSNRVYLLGGENGANKIYSAPINSDGTIGTWTTESNRLSEVLHKSQAVVTSSRVYLLGGYSSSYTNKIYSAPINTDGTIGAWITEGNTLPETLGLSQAVVTSSRVYLLGEYNGSTTNKIYSAPINSDGTIGTWSSAANTLPEGLYLSQAVVTSNRVYLLGGQDGNDITNKVYSAPINTDGTIGTWSIDTITLPEVLQNSQAVVTSNRVYLLGGYGRGTTNKIYSAPINTDGTIGTWSIDTITLPEALDASQAVVTSSKVYLLGGYSRTTNGITNKIYSAPFTGGLNDYMPFITAPIGSTTASEYPADQFRLPDYSSREQSGKYFFIKY